jgi:hypothetical protein
MKQLPTALSTTSVGGSVILRIDFVLSSKPEQGHQQNRVSLPSPEGRLVLRRKCFGRAANRADEKNTLAVCETGCVYHQEESGGT